MKQSKPTGKFMVEKLFYPWYVKPLVWLGFNIKSIRGIFTKVDD